MVPGSATATLRRWNARSKSGSSSQCGGAGSGDVTTRCRNISTVRLRYGRSSTSRPLIRSAEPEEDWLWCYVDEVPLALAV